MKIHVDIDLDTASAEDTRIIQHIGRETEIIQQTLMRAQGASPADLRPSPMGLRPSGRVTHCAGTECPVCGPSELLPPAVLDPLPAWEAPAPTPRPVFQTDLGIGRDHLRRIVTRVQTDGHQYAVGEFATLPEHTMNAIDAYVIACGSLAQALGAVWRERGGSMTGDQMAEDDKAARCTAGEIIESLTILAAFPTAPCRMPPTYW